MPRIQINTTGLSTRVGTTWAMTAQFAVPALPSGPAALAAILATIRTTLVGSSAFKGGIGTQYSFVNLHGLAYATPLGPAQYVADAGGASVQGSFVSGPIPLATVVSERTNASGPSYRGRTYFPMATQQADGSNLTALQTAVSGAWLAWHNAMIAGLQGAGLSPVHVVLSRKTGDMTPISYIQVGNRVDTARGRFGDAPEVYTTYALPSSQQVTPSQIGLPDDVDDDTLQQILEAANSYPPLAPEGFTLGPLKEYGPALLQTLTKAPPPVPAAEGGQELDDEDGIDG